jgi:hypothetical protein
MRLIGIDFDNTIACYDHVFHKVAKGMGFLVRHEDLLKSEVKEEVYCLSGGDRIWQKIQGQVYGKYMNEARPYPGVLEFMWLSVIRGDELIIVSHKSEYGHFDETRTSLRKAAKDWIEEQLVKATFGLVFAKQDSVYFEETRKNKIDRISKSGCDIFIDDLIEVFNEADFPSGVEKILFSTNTPIEKQKIDWRMDSWRRISSLLYGEINKDDIFKILKHNFPSLNIKSVLQIKGRGNSRIYRITDNASQEFALKIYPDLHSDPRPRLRKESFVCDSLSRAGLPVPALVEISEALNWGIYEWVEGIDAETQDTDFISQSVKFIERINFDNGIYKTFEDFPLASEACLTGSEIISQILNRSNKLLKVDDIKLQNFINNDLLPAIDIFSSNAEKLMGEFFIVPLKRDFQILSPSDFGGHNSLMDVNGRYIFLDFEYFGWDDPVKLVSDFFWHPGMKLSSESLRIWLQMTERLFDKDPLYLKRLSAYLPLYGLRWCLILLNEYLPERFIARSHANEIDRYNLEGVLNLQLQKAKVQLNKIHEMANDG